MDLLESVLRSANAEAYIETFKKSNIEAATLPLLTKSDLNIIGVDDVDVQEAILEKSSKLLIPHEKKIDLTLTKEYAEQVLNQMAHQLHLHHASLSCGIIRKDVIVCDVKLQKATECLQNCITSLEERLDEFESKFGASKKQKRAKGTNVLIIVGASSLALIVIGKLCSMYILKS